MQYIRLSVLKQHFPKYNFPLSAEEADLFRTDLYASELGKRQGVFENERLITGLSSPQEILFRGWTDQNSGLIDLLEDKPMTTAFRDTAAVLNHSLAGYYQVFISPFLRPKLEITAQKSDRQSQTMTLSFVVLLTEQDANAMQEIVYRPLNAEREALEQSLAKAVSEADLLKAVQPYLKADFVNLLNSFTMSYYRVRTSWMELLMSVVYHHRNTRRLALHILQQLQRLELSAEHVKELKALERTITSGELKVEESAFPWRRVLTLGTGAVLIAAAFYFILTIPPHREEPEPEDQTAYMSFTEEEREKLDSLLQQATMQHQQSANPSDSDMMPVGIELTQKEDLKNERIRKLMDSWKAKDTTNHQPDPRQSKRETRVFPSTANLRNQKGDVAIQFQNKTEESVLVLVFKNRKGQPVSSSYLEKGAWMNFNAAAGEYIICLPGTKVPDQLSEEKLPFDQVNSHFFAHLDELYVISETAPGIMKLVWTESGSEFYLLDINNGLQRP